MRPMTARRMKDFLRPNFSLTVGAIIHPIIIPAVPRPVPADCSDADKVVVMTPAVDVVIVLPYLSLK